MARRSPILDLISKRFGSKKKQPDYLAVDPQQRDTTERQTPKEARGNITGGRSATPNLNDIGDDPATERDFHPR